MNFATLVMLDAEVGKESFKSTVEIVAMEHNMTAKQLLSEYDEWRYQRAQASIRRNRSNGSFGRSIADL